MGPGSPKPRGKGTRTALGSKPGRAITNQQLTDKGEARKGLHKLKGARRPSYLGKYGLAEDSRGKSPATHSRT